MKSKILLTASTSLLLSGAVFADTNWTGGANNNTNNVAWTTADNWDAGIPSNTSTGIFSGNTTYTFNQIAANNNAKYLIENGTTVSVNAFGNEAVGYITVEDGASLVIRSADIRNWRELNIGTATGTDASKTVFNGAVNANNANYTGILNITNATWKSDGNKAMGNINRGTINLTNAIVQGRSQGDSTFGIGVKWSGNPNAVINMYGNTSISEIKTFGLAYRADATTADANGTLNLYGGSLETEDLYMAKNTGSSVEAYLNMCAMNTDKDGKTTSDVNEINVKGNAYIGSGSVVNLFMKGADFDSTLINITENLTVDEGAQLVIDFTGFVATGDDDFQLISYADGSTPFSKDSITIKNFDDQGGLFACQIDEVFENGIGVFIQAIPEPSTYAAIFGALALAFAAYRKRK